MRARNEFRTLERICLDQAQVASTEVEKAALLKVAEDCKRAAAATQSDALRDSRLASLVWTIREFKTTGFSKMADWMRTIRGSNSSIFCVVLLIASAWYVVTNMPW